jgi:hypothetical protein
MIPSNKARPWTSARPLVLAASLALVALPMQAAPGAHGPDGEHLDQPGAVRGVSSLPRLEAKSEAFELVAELRANEFVILIDRYDTNEPVLGAKVEVESGAAKAAAAFRGEHGDYVVTDAALLKKLAAPGEHGLVFTLAAGKENDLLDGTLIMRAVARAAGAAGAHGHDHGDHGHDHDIERAAWTGAGLAALAAIGGALWWRRWRRPMLTAQGGGR